MPRQGRGHRRGRHQAEPVAVSEEELQAWFTGSLPDDWFTGPLSIVFDRDEIVVSGNLPTPEVDDDQRSVAEHARITAFREETRATRMNVASIAERQFQRKVSWEATCGDSVSNFTRANVPAMTRLTLSQRATLDTLIDAGVARSRADALSWCVKLVGQNEEAWLGELKEALSNVEEARAAGPHSTR